MAISAKAGDITVQFQDSCNCCCWGKTKTPKPTTPVFIKQDGAAEKFDLKKVTSQMESLQRSISNLNAHLTRIAQERELDPDVIKEHIAESAKVSLDEENPSSITFEMLERINTVITRIFNA